MPLAASDLEAFASASMVTTDAATPCGGVIDLLRRVIFTEQATGTIEIISDNGSDTMDCTVVGRLASGIAASETLALTGTNAKAFENTYERILSVELDSAANGIITVRLSSAGATIGTIAATERGFMRLFRNAISESAEVSRYEKIFLKNTHGSLDLLNATIVETADPEAVITFTLAITNDDNNSVTNRRTAPGAAIIEPDTFDGSEKSLQDTDLAFGEAIGVWVKQTLAAYAIPFEATYTLRLQGASS